MPAKPTSSRSPNAKKPKDSTRESSTGTAKPTGAAADADAEAYKKQAPENKAQVLDKVTFSGFEGLPSPNVDAIVQLLNIKYEELAQIFAHYCKMSECKTVKMATQLKLGAHNSTSIASLA